MMWGAGSLHQNRRWGGMGGVRWGADVARGCHYLSSHLTPTKKRSDVELQRAVLRYDLVLIYLRQVRYHGYAILVLTEARCIGFY